MTSDKLSKLEVIYLDQHLKPTLFVSFFKILSNDNDNNNDNDNDNDNSLLNINAAME